MKDYKMAVDSGDIHFMYGEASYVTSYQGQRINTFLELAKPLHLTEGEVASIMGCEVPQGKTTQDTELVLMKLMCLCGYANTKVIERKGVA